MKAANMKKKPNILIILNDDMGYSDIGCYGGEVNTPALDALAGEGLRFTQFYNSPRCSPTRASLLTGLHPHQTGIGVLTDNQLPDGYEGTLNRKCITIAELLKRNGYRTYMSGKWHLCNDWFSGKDNWPIRRGFDEFYGIIAGSANYYNPITLTRNEEKIDHEALSEDYYLTDAITEIAVKYLNEHKDKEDEPFFMYVAYTAPHWPLQAFEEDIAKYKGRFDAGWDVLREERLERMIKMGILNESARLSPRDETQPPWDAAENKQWQARRMEVYAAQIERMDRGIASTIKTLKANGEFEDTLIIFLADNGACAEDLQPDERLIIEGHLCREYAKNGNKVKIGNHINVMPGKEDTYQSYAVAWANLSNTPFRRYKHWTHEGGISTPFIISWPERIKDAGAFRRSPAQLTDIMATIIDVTGAEYPENYNGHSILPYEGESLAPLFDADSRERKMLFWEHEGNAAVRDGKFKLVKKYPDEWELYDIEKDRSELCDISNDFLAQKEKMIKAYDKWAERCCVLDWDIVKDI